MKNLLILQIVLLVSSLSVNAQTRPAKAPVRPVTKKPASSVTPTPKRPNSVALPQKPTPTVEAPVQVAKQPTPVSPNKPSSGSPLNRTYTLSAYRSERFGYQKGDRLVNIGVGLSSYYYGNPVGISYESGIDDDISVGAQFDYNSGNYDGYGYYYSSRWGYTATYFGVRGSYHVNRLLKINSSKVDLYAGAGVGYQRFRWKEAGYGYGYDYRSGLFLNYFVGGKYYFSNKVGAFVELGYTGLSSSRAGLSAKF